MCQRRRVTAFVADERRQSAIMKNLTEGVERLGAVPNRFRKRRRTDRNDHALLKLQRALGVLTAVDQVHHRNGQRAGARAAEIPEERHADAGRGRARDRERDAQNRVGAENMFVRRTVEFDQLPSISRCAVASSPSSAGPSISLT